MKFTLIKNTDESKVILYKIARIIYAETNCSSLRAAESLACMISNLCIKSQKSIENIISDKKIFESLNKNSLRHDCLLVDAARPDFQMCLRTAAKMIRGDLPDIVMGATQFHRIENIPDWSIARGYILEIDDLLFYL